MTDNFHMETNMAGGLLGGFKRALAGESMFLTRYTCYRDMGQIAFSWVFLGTSFPSLGTRTADDLPEGAFMQ